jgi:hypothetical protein
VAGGVEADAPVGEGVAVSSLHYPLRPWWTCAACSVPRLDPVRVFDDAVPQPGGVPWPCENRQRQLLGEYADLGMQALWWYMAGAALEASADLVSVPAVWLRWRFVDWVPWEPVVVGRMPVAVR